ncbi:MAG: O-acetyl-ADP-ribose deacetylase [Melioribacteraceae bacterium]|nr:O-acetyl-ADP-ribose deacetylase [Melioribacteraceae bacterium]
MDKRIEIIRGDITELKVDAIVNAANESLLGGGGVDGAIHRKAGARLLEECRTLNGCKTGYAKITNGYNLPTKFVIHTVGPVWKGGNNNEDQLLSNCYKNSLNLAIGNKINTIAFPSISTGIYGFPFERACKIALKVITEFLKNDSTIKKVYLICFSKSDFDDYKSIALL